MKTEKPRLYQGRGTPLRRMLRFGWLPLLTVAVCAGCRPGPTAASGTAPVGTYTLVSVDGKNVPCEVRHGDATLKVASGTFDINADGTCQSRIVFSPPRGGAVTRDVRATYTLAGEKLTMHWEGAGTTTGIARGNDFTMNNEGMVFAYRKPADNAGNAH